MQAQIFKLPNLLKIHEFSIGGLASVCKSFPRCPNTIFFGLQFAGSIGAQPSNKIKLVLQGKEIIEENAHMANITAFEYASINGQEVLFSGGADGMLKAWDITGAQTPTRVRLDKISEKNFNMPITTLQMTSETFLVIGLENGTFSGWNLVSNAFDILQAHQSPVRSLILHDKFLISGDATDII